MHSSTAPSLEGEDHELLDPALKLEPEVMPVSSPNGYLKVGILKFDRHKPAMLDHCLLHPWDSQHSASEGTEFPV